ncbi:hypothetical protein Bbelb_350190 [Branchiostoma belcheri]|nr:hypothetical protein Bbelb_350190 [Branchiostoma belcheri]
MPVPTTASFTVGNTNMLQGPVSGRCVHGGAVCGYCGRREDTATVAFIDYAAGGLYTPPKRTRIESVESRFIIEVDFPAQMLLHSVCREDTAKACSADSPKEIEAKATAKMGSYLDMLEVYYCHSACTW